MLASTSRALKRPRVVIDISSSPSPPRQAYTTASDASTSSLPHILPRRPLAAIAPTQSLKRQASSSPLPSPSHAHLTTKGKAAVHTSPQKRPYYPLFYKKASPAPAKSPLAPIPAPQPLATAPNESDIDLSADEADVFSPKSAAKPPINDDAARAAAKAAKKAAVEALRAEIQATREAEKVRMERAPVLEMPPARKPFFTRDPKKAVAYLKEMQGPLAWDLEWVFSFRGGSSKVGVMQFCDEKRNLVFQIPPPKRIPAEIIEVLGDHSRVKLGVNIAGDGKKMLNDFDVKVNGLLDINDLARAAHPDGVFESRMISLQRLAFRYLERHLRKGSERTSNWDSTLSQAQINYAALDTYSTMQIYRRLIGIAEIYDVQLDIASMLKHHTPPPPALLVKAPKIDTTAPLKGRHLKAVAAVESPDLEKVEGEQALPIVAASNQLGVRETTVVSYLVEALELKPGCIDASLVLTAASRYTDVLPTLVLAALERIRTKHLSQ